MRKTIADLDAASLVKKSKEGRRVRHTINPDTTAWHDNRTDLPILDFLNVLGIRQK